MFQTYTYKPKHMHVKVYRTEQNVYTTLHNTTRVFPCFPLDGLAVYIIPIYGFSLLYTRLRSGASPNRLIWLAVVSRDSKLQGVEIGAASINETTNFVAKKTNTQVPLK